MLAEYATGQVRSMTVGVRTSLQGTATAMATSSMFSGSAVAVAQLTLMEMAYAMMSTLVWAHTMLWALAMALARATRMTTAFVTKMMWLVALTLEL